MPHIIYMDNLNDFDFVLLGETWHSSSGHITFEGFDHFECARPKFNKKAKRNSGGLVVYYKNIYSAYFTFC